MEIHYGGMTSRLSLGNLIVDKAAFRVWVDDAPVELTYVEFELLYALARNSQRVLTREHLVQTVWGEEGQGETRKLNVHISRLRKKLTGIHPYSIRTVPKRGYSLADDAPAPPEKPSAGQTLARDKRGHLAARTL
jgi:DNA-binding response OmpR family regulator